MGFMLLKVFSNLGNSVNLCNYFCCLGRLTDCLLATDLKQTLKHESQERKMVSVEYPYKFTEVIVRFPIKKRYHSWRPSLHDDHSDEAEEKELHQEM